MNGDHMPAEVATALLVEPKSKLSNRMRKVCKAARQNPVPSNYPIRKHRDELTDAYTYTYSVKQAPKDIEVRMVRKMSEATFVQLRKWLARSIARRLIVQRKYLAITGTRKVDEHAREVLEAASNRLDKLRDTIEEELKRRIAK